MSEHSSQRSNRVRASRPSPPGFSRKPALFTVLDEAPESLLRNTLKLLCNRTEGEASNVFLMLEEAKYYENCEDDEDLPEQLTVDHKPHKDADPVADTLFMGLLARKAELQKRRKQQKKELADEMAHSRAEQRAIQRNKDSAAEWSCDRDTLISEAADITDQIQKLKAKTKHRAHHSFRYKEAVGSLKNKLRMKSSAAEQLRQQIAALNSVPPRLVNCQYCHTVFDATRKEPEACRRHKGALEFNWDNAHWPRIWDARDDVQGVMTNMSKDLIAYPEKHKHSLPYFKWTCCERTGDSVGCNTGKHEERDS